MPRRSWKVARDARTGWFIPMWLARRRPRTSVIETMTRKCVHRQRQRR